MNTRTLELDEAIRDLQDASHDRFRSPPDSNEHRQAIDREVDADHELDDVIRKTMIDDRS